MTIDFDGYIPQPYYVAEREDWSSERKERSGMPYHGNMTVFNWNLYHKNLTPEKEVVKTFIREYKRFSADGSGLYISSETMGSGKTFLACCVANELIERYNAVVKFINIVDYIMLRGEETEPYLNCGLLILDDIGAQSSKQEWVSEIVFRLVDYRHRNNKSTIYTSNLIMNMDDRANARIYEHSFEVKLPEVSIRKQKADERKRKMLQTLNGGAT